MGNWGLYQGREASQRRWVCASTDPPVSQHRKNAVRCARTTVRTHTHTHSITSLRFQPSIPPPLATDGARSTPTGSVFLQLRSCEIAGERQARTGIVRSCGCSPEIMDVGLIWQFWATSGEQLDYRNKKSKGLGFQPKMKDFLCQQSCPNHNYFSSLCSTSMASYYRIFTSEWSLRKKKDSTHQHVTWIFNAGTDCGS